MSMRVCAEMFQRFYDDEHAAVERARRILKEWEEIEDAHVREVEISALKQFSRMHNSSHLYAPLVATTVPMSKFAMALGSSSQ